MKLPVSEIKLNPYNHRTIKDDAFKKLVKSIKEFPEMADIKLKRKAMNSFLCSTERPFKFIGRLNEDVTTYVNLGSRGLLFFTITNVAINQKRHQSEKNGLTEVYLDYGTYVKSFFSVMYNPSCVRISDVGDKYKRIHHKVKWNNAVPKILSENVKKYNSVR